MFSTSSDVSWLFSAGIVLASLTAVGALLYVSGLVRYIPNDKVGVVEKLWSATGSVKNGLLALGETHLRAGGLVRRLELRLGDPR